MKVRPHPQFVKCPACGKLQRLRSDSRVRAHRAYRAADRCPGSRAATTGWRTVHNHLGLFLVAPSRRDRVGGVR